MHACLILSRKGKNDSEDVSEVVRAAILLYLTVQAHSSCFIFGLADQNVLPSVSWIEPFLRASVGAELSESLVG